MEAWGDPAPRVERRYETISFKIPKGIRKLTLKKAAKFVAPVAALAIPGVGAAVVAGVGLAGRAVAGAVKGTAATVGNVAKATGNTAYAVGQTTTKAAGELVNRGTELATDLATTGAALREARDAVARTRGTVQDAATQGDRSNEPSTMPAPSGTVILLAVVLALVLLVRRK